MNSVLRYDDLPKEVKAQVDKLAGKKKRVKKEEVIPEAGTPTSTLTLKTCKPHGISWLGEYPCVFCEEF